MAGIDAGGLELTHRADGDTNGVLYWLGSRPSRVYQNPALCGAIEITSSALKADSQPLACFVGRELVRGALDDIPGAWFIVDLKSYVLIPTAYSIRHYVSKDSHALRHWRLEGQSPKSSVWTVLYEHSNDMTLSKAGQYGTWRLPQSGAVAEAAFGLAFQRFRIRMTGKNSSTNYANLCCSGLEFYGRLFAIAAAAAPPIQPAIASAAASPDLLRRASAAVSPSAMGGSAHVHMIASADVDEKKHVMSFSYVGNDFDTRGILYHLGCRTPEGGIGALYRNPVESGAVAITSIPMKHDSAKLPTFVGREPARGVLEDRPGAWFCVDFQSWSVAPNYYSLRHYSSKDSHCLRYWVLEASNDGLHFTVLTNHRDERSINGAGQSASFVIPPLSVSAAASQTPFFRYFRVRMTGPNSSGHYHNLCCSGFELYGKLIERKLLTPAVHAPSAAAAAGAGGGGAFRPIPHMNELFTGRIFPYTGEMDTTGLFYWLGTSNGDGGMYTNPCDAGRVVLSSTPLKSDSDPLKFIIGRQLKRVVLHDQPNGWFCVDLKGAFRFLPTHYAYRHYSSKDTHALRSWRLDASNDGQTWTSLRDHIDDTSICRAGQWQMFPLDVSRSTPLTTIVADYYARTEAKSAAAAMPAPPGGALHDSPMAAAGAAVAIASASASVSPLRMSVDRKQSGVESPAASAVPNSALAPAAGTALGYRYFRIFMTGKNSSAHFHNLTGSGFELYGIMNPAVRTASDPPPVYNNAAAQLDLKDQKSAYPYPPYAAGASVEGVVDGEDKDDADAMAPDGSGSEEEDDIPLIPLTAGGSGAALVTGTTPRGGSIIGVPDEDEATEGESSTEHLTRVLKRIGIAEYTDACLREKVDVSVLKILGDAELVLLLPLLGPRTKVRHWQKAQKALERRKMIGARPLRKKKSAADASAAASASASAASDQKRAAKAAERDCVVCLDTESDHVILDCMHVCLCGGCAAKVVQSGSCPKCRKPVKEVRRIFN